jgi:hypothetical protein
MIFKIIYVRKILKIKQKKKEKKGIFKKRVWQ